MGTQIQKQTSHPNPKFNWIRTIIHWMIAFFVKLWNWIKKNFFWIWKDIEKLKSWMKSRHKQILITVFLTAVIILLIRIGYNYDWTGFTASGDPKSQSYKPAKTLWDWLQLIIIPVVLGGVAFLFNYLQKKIEEQRAQTQKDIESQRTIDQEQANVLNTYIDDMSKLLLEQNLRSSQVDNEVRTIAQTKTQTALDRLNPERKVRVLKFLYAAKLLEKVDPLIDLSTGDYLEGLDLTNINLRGANLEKVNLSSTNLSYANLAEANLQRAILNSANLSYTSLYKTNLFMARLNEAKLYRTDFLESRLESATLCGVDLTKAMGFEKLNARNADLRNADLHGLRLTNAHLGKAYLEGANLESADLTGAQIYEGKLKGAKLSNAILTDTQLYDADLTGAVVTNEQLEKVVSLRGTTLPDGTINQGQFLAGSRLDQVEKWQEELQSSHENN